MAMNAGWVEITFVAGVATGSWRHPDYATALGTGLSANDPGPIQLDNPPSFIIPVCLLDDQLHIGFIQWQATTTGIRGVSTHNGDTSTWRIWAFVMVPPVLYQVG